MTCVEDKSGNLVTLVSCKLGSPGSYKELILSHGLKDSLWSISLTLSSLFIFLHSAHPHLLYQRLFLGGKCEEDLDIFLLAFKNERAS